MSYTPISKQAVDAAPALDFPERRPAKADLTITVKATVDGFDTEVCFTGSIDQLLQVTQRLRTLGAEPVSAARMPPTPTKGAQKPTQRVQPAYDADGDPICPVHHKPLQEGKWGLFCSTKDRETGEYCKLKFKFTE